MKVKTIDGPGQVYDGRWLTLIQSHRIEDLLTTPSNVNKYQAQYSDVVAKLKLKVTRETEAVRDLLFRFSGAPCQQRTKLAGSTVSSSQAEQVRELLERFAL